MPIHCAKPLYSSINSSDTSRHETFKFLKKMLFLDLSLFVPWLFKINFFGIVVIVILFVLRVAFAADVAQKVLDRLWENLVCYRQANLYQLSVKLLNPFRAFHSHLTDQPCTQKS
jgi:hypothetical protein